MDEILFDIIEVTILLVVMIAVVFFGRWARSEARSFLPIEPITVFFYIALVVIYYLTLRFDIAMDVIVYGLVVASLAYIPGYMIGDFPTKGIVELQVDKKIILRAHRIAYYYNIELRSHCIQIKGFFRILKRMVLGIHDTMDFPFAEVQSLTSVTVNNNYISLTIDGAMTYICIPEKRTIKKLGREWKYTHYRYVACDITKQGPWDFFLMTSLYLAAMDRMDAANAASVKAKIEYRLAAAEGGATILESISKMDPEDAAVSLKELKEFVQSEFAKTTQAATEEAAPATKEEPEKKKRWFRRTK